MTKFWTDWTMGWLLTPWNFVETNAMESPESALYRESMALRGTINHKLHRRQRCNVWLTCHQYSPLTARVENQDGGQWKPCSHFCSPAHPEVVHSAVSRLTIYSNILVRTVFRIKGFAGDKWVWKKGLQVINRSGKCLLGKLGHT